MAGWSNWERQLKAISDKFKQIEKRMDEQQKQLPQSEQRCENCRFSMFYEKDEDAGEMMFCHKHAPAPGPLDIGGNWPSVYTYNWCGQWEPRESEGAPITREAQAE